MNSFGSTRPKKETKTSSKKKKKVPLPVCELLIKVKDETKRATKPQQGQQTRTCILPVEAFHHKLQVLLVVLQIVNKLLKVQLSI